MNFLPPDYKAPSGSNNYWKPQEGENRVRIMSKPIIGWEDWTPERKPVRFKMNEKPSNSIDPKKPLKHFWAFIIWNENEKKIQIMHVTQATIRRAIEALCNDSDWGIPFEYDIKVNKTGDGIDTEYTINPVPHKPMSQEMIDAFNKNPINLNALYSGEDPFSLEWKDYTPLGTIDENIAVSTEKKEGNVANQDMMKEFFDRSYKRFPVDAVESYISEWCDHFGLKPEHAVWSFMSDYEAFEKSMLDRKKKK